MSYNAFSLYCKTRIDHISGIFLGLLWFAERNETNWKYEHLRGVLYWILTTFAKRSNPLLYLKKKLRHLAMKCKSIIKKKKFREAAVVQFTSIDVRSRWIIRLRDMTSCLKNIAWLKLLCSMFLIGIQYNTIQYKSFRWVFSNNNGFPVIICGICGLNWPIHL